MPLALVMSTQEQAPSIPGARLVTTDGRDLPLAGTSLRAEAGGGIARTVVEQRFTNPHAEALTVTYSLPLPADGAVSGFAFRIGGRRVQGEVRGREDARQAFERAVLEGRSAALLAQERSSLFTQEIGHIPPGDTLGPNDRLEMLELSSRVRAWRGRPAAVSGEVRREALAWVRDLEAGGGTDMVEGILEALPPVRDEAQRQVLLVTDGQIGFETRVISAIRGRLPRGSRLHTVGVGSAVNRSLTGPAARAGAGIEVILGLGEDPERAARRLVARTDAPLVVDLEVSGSAVMEHALRRLPDLFAGAPALVAVALRPERGDLVVRGRTAGGTWEQRLTVDPTAYSEGSPAVAALFGRESVEDLELDLAAGDPRRATDEAIERIGLDFQLATRLTSWIAVTADITVDPRGGSRRERMPHELPHGMSAEGIGLRGEEVLSSSQGLALHPTAPVAVTTCSPRMSADRAVTPAPPFATRTSAFPARLLVFPIAFGLAYSFLGSIGLAIAVAFGVVVALAIVRAALSRLFR
jgi:hypothetical protein